MKRLVKILDFNGEGSIPSLEYILARLWKVANLEAECCKH